jgi:FMN phosphatase YigB (HAD superfamily)
MIDAGALPLDAVTFDFWDTLVHAPEASVTRTERRNRILAAFAEGGVEIDRDELGRVLAIVRDTFDRNWAANVQFTGRDGTAVMLEALEVDVDDATHQRVYDAFVGTDLPWIPNLTPNVADAIRDLKALDLRVGIICDVGLSPSTILRSYLEHHGVLDLFDHWSFSDEVGAYKPDPTIFAHALEGLGGIDPTRAADVVGARAYGMVSVRYRGSNDDVHRPGEGDRSIPSAMTPTETDAHEADHVLSDHARLLDVLGLR